MSVERSERPLLELLMRRLVLAVAALVLLRADMFPDASNAKQPEAQQNLGIAPSLTSFGAKCDGTTDDADAFDAAALWLKTAPQRLVELPVGVCLTSRPIVLGDGRQHSTALSAPLVGGETSITVASAANVQAGDNLTVWQDGACGAVPCVYRGTVSAAPVGTSVPISPAFPAAAAAAGRPVYVGKVSSYFGGGFKGYGACSDKLSGDAVSAIKAHPSYPLPATTTLSAPAAANALTLSVGSVAGMELGTVLGIALDSGAVHWTHVTRTPTGTTINIANEVPSAASGGAQVTLAKPLVKIAGPTISPRLEGVCIDGAGRAAIGLETSAVVAGKFRDLGGIGVTQYTGIGAYLHSASALIGGYGGSSNSDYTLTVFAPANNKTIAWWLAGTAENNIAFSRNHFYGGMAQMGGNDLTAAGIRSEFTDNNMFYKAYTSPHGPALGAGLYRQPSVGYLGFPVENLFLGSALIGGVTDGTATGGSVSNDLYWQYGTGDSEPVPTGKAVGVTTGGRLFNISQLDLVSSLTTPQTVNFRTSPGGTYIWGLGRGGAGASGVSLESANDIGFYTNGATPGAGSLRQHIAPTGQVGFGGITQAGSHNGWLQVPAGGVGTAGLAGYSGTDNATMYWNVRRGGPSTAGLGLESGNDIGFYVGATAVGTSTLALAIDNKSHLKASGAAPALTACGTSPAIVGSDIAGTVTLGTGSPTGCVITFAQAYVAAPICTVTWRATPLASQSYTTSTSALTLTQTGTSSNLVDYVCYARSGG